MHLALVLALALQCPDGSPPPCGAGASRPAQVSARSVAVLYFNSRSPDSSDAYLADGLTEGVITRLARDSRLTVKSTAAVERFRGRGAPPDSVGRALRVANLVSGSVARSGHRLRVTVELVRASTGVSLWAGEFDRDDADFFDIQSMIADTVSREIAGRLAPGSAATRRPTTNAEAYDRYLQGNYRLARRTPDDLRVALSHYEAAIQLDPAFAGAHARIALAYAVALDWGWPSFDVSASIRAGLAASARAIELDSMLPDAWTARGYMLRFANARTYAGVQEAFRRAIRLAPRDGEARLQYGWALANMGQADSAIAQLKQSIQLDPERGVTRFTLAWVLVRTPRGLTEARAELDSGLAMDPAALSLRGMRAWTRLMQGDTAGALGDIRDEHRDDIRISGSAHVAMLWQSGDTAAAREEAAELSRDWPPAPAHVSWGAAWAALAWAGVRDVDKTMDILERIEPQGLTVWWMLQFPGFDPIRRDPRFAGFMADLAPHP